ncbi:Msr family ABC-F type ribosomal protection protein [Virgibacillus oceani]|uniref:Msr family ABC-F type ribosomal protection protein n=1 Tax=Virgibacillus oceani TaxID=1479511 RepID=A0A917HH22_9BACI|nr:ABC-F type ribosomal protection protein [Virgibacillus oceani]GGG78622.1 Msr family ABC-F type ribosomal protection protein [Virgibacillus oceani]
MENVCIELENIELSFLDKLVLNIPRLAIHQFDRIGIVGKNGAGKSTLLKLISGQITPDKGNMKRFIEFAYFDQLAEADDKDVNYGVMGKLSIPKTAIQNFSGGELTRLKLADLFSNYHEGMLIDEPTTHLDEKGIKFLLDELTYYYGALVLVSHDRYVLDHLVTKIWEIEGGSVTEYTGNYSDYVAQKELSKKQQHEQYEKYVKEKSRLMQAAEAKMKKAEKVTQVSKRVSKKEVKAKANKMFMTKSKDTSQKGIQRAAKALEQRVEQMDVVEAPITESMIRFHQPQSLQMHNKFPIMADRLTLTCGDKLLLKEVSFQFPLGRTIAITGDNGSGKTTLLHHIIQDGKGLTISPKVVFGVYEQMDYQFYKDETVLAYMKARSDYDEGRIRSSLHAMGITGNELKKNVRHLSGGEAIRVVLCHLFLGRFNVLILDEPTNFLDVFCIEALEQFLEGYDGTVLIISHDQTFIGRVADVVYEIDGQKLRLRN